MSVYDRRMTAASPGPQPLTDPADTTVPTLAAVFALAAGHPDGGPIFLDTKLPPGDVDVARRMARQYLDAFVRQPDLRGRAFIACPDRALLAVMQDEFAAAPGFEDFRDFALDHEELSAFAVGHDADEATPLRDAGDNAWLSIGAAYKPLATGGFDDLLRLVRATVAELRVPGGRHAGKRLCVWTIDDDAQQRAVAALGPDVILTNRPLALTAILDELYGPRGGDASRGSEARDTRDARAARRPLAMCHRGGPDECGAPENTLPAIEAGLRLGDGVEFDVCAAIDGAVVWHDNDPEGVIAVLRRSGGGGVGAWKPVFRGPAALANRRVDQLTVEQVQHAYGYARDEKGALAGVVTGLGAIGRLIRDAVD
jgi:glycerophosphoryl diester phosphodiesterase